MMQQEQEIAPIKDHFGRLLKDLRISVIDQCNFRCTYCMPKEIFGKDYAFLPENELLSFDEIVRLAETFAGLGVDKIRITGGEPLMRKNLDQLIKRLIDIPGIQDIALTTNAVFLPKQAKKLKEAGLQRVNVSLDAIEDEVFKQINGKGVITLPVLKGIDRKSTRLNSSHVAISYAVFCLKKKKKIEEHEIKQK